jgi:hypothetical protein
VSARRLIAAVPSDVPMSDLRCFWCHRPFGARHGGRAQRFCRPWCRLTFHSAVRAWALDAIENGALTVADIKNDLPATRALLTTAEAARPMPGLRVLNLQILDLLSSLS